jgi:CBS domain-containing protein
MKKVKDVMTRDVEVVRPNDTLATAAARMKELNIGSMPVCDGRRLMGMLTDRDITVRATSAGRDPMATRVQEMMTPEVITTFDEDDVDKAAKTMQQHQIRRLPVVDRAHQLVGIVSIGDLAVETGDDKLIGQTLEEISEPAQPDR